jgi:RNA polymerase primary sigma factor
VNWVNYTQCELHQKLGREPSLEEIAERLDLDVEKIDELLSLVKDPMSLDAPVSDDSESTVSSFIEDPNSTRPEDPINSADLREEIGAALADLTPREEKVVRMRYGIGEPTQYSLEEIGNRFCLTRERIRQIEIKALRKLRHARRARNLQSFMDTDE